MLVNVHKMVLLPIRIHISYWATQGPLKKCMEHSLTIRGGGGGKKHTEAGWGWVVWTKSLHSLNLHIIIEGQKFSRRS